MIKKIMMLLFLCFTVVFSDEFEGDWMIPSGKTVIRIVKKGEEYSGYVVWLKEKEYPKGDKMEGLEQIDRKNPNSKLRNRKVIGLQVVGDMRQDPKNPNVISGGWVYDSWNGKKYYGQAKIIDKNTLALKGSLDKWGVFGYSQECKRVNLKGKE